MYHPLLIFDGDTDQLITAILRPGNVHASRGVLLVLKRLIPLLRQRWPGIPIELRADSGFAVPTLYDSCEAQDVTYRIGLIPNRRLEAIAAPLLSQAKAQQAQTGEEKVRLVEETTYQAGTWSKARRVVYKAETMAEGPNTRFIVTNGTAPAEDATASYDIYVHRGEAEGWIKDLKRACKADRLSDQRFWANQFRLFLHAAAYWLLDTLRPLAQSRRRCPSPTRHPAPPAPQGRRLRPPTPHACPPPLGHRPSSTAPLGPPRRSLEDPRE